MGSTQDAINEKIKILAHLQVVRKSVLKDIRYLKNKRIKENSEVEVNNQWKRYA